MLIRRDPLDHKRSCNMPLSMQLRSQASCSTERCAAAQHAAYASRSWARAASSRAAMGTTTLPAAPDVVGVAGAGVGAAMPLANALSPMQTCGKVGRRVWRLVLSSWVAQQLHRWEQRV